VSRFDSFAILKITAILKNSRHFESLVVVMLCLRGVPPKNGGKV
jgi:hypothetical protein